MPVHAFIPVRGGSQSIPLKNIKNINGKPLIYWSLISLEQAKGIDRIIVATDSDEIVKSVLSFGFKKVEIYRRSAENARDTSSTESVMLEYIKAGKMNPADLFVLVQATNPFTTARDFEQALSQFKTNKTAKSLLSVVKTKRFFWELKGKALNYNPEKRPRRQDYAGLFMENGAFYISSVKNIVASKNRLTKPVMTFEMPAFSGYEIDEVDDWIICEQLLKKHKEADEPQFANIKLFLCDVDGVLTDAGMYYTEKGDEIKKFNTYDGIALNLMQKSGIKVGILTAENRDLNRNRAKKLKLDFDFHGVQNKLAQLSTLLKELKIDFKDVAYVGDDINDIEVLKKVGFAFCPSTAQPEVLEISNVKVLNTAGGKGVIREIYNLIK